MQVIQRTSLIPDHTASQDLSAGGGTALSTTTSFSKAFGLLQVLIKASVAITETITVTLDSANGAAYDTVLATKAMTAESSYVFSAGDSYKYQKGDEIKVECTAGNATGTVKCVVKSEEL